MNAPAARAGLRPPTRPAWQGPPDVLRVIWTQPRATLRWILDHDATRLAPSLVIAASASAAIADTSLLENDPTLGQWAGLVAFAATVALGLVAWFVAALALTAFGRALGGAGTRRELLMAVGYGLVPAAASLPFALLRVWSRWLDNASGELLAAACMTLLWGWSIGLIVLGTAEAHRFSAARAVLCGLAVCGLYALVGVGLHLWLGVESP